MKENQVKFVTTVLPRKEKKQPYQKNFTVPKQQLCRLQYSKKWAIDVRKMHQKTTNAWSDIEYLLKPIGKSDDNENVINFWRDKSWLNFLL